MNTQESSLILLKDTIIGNYKIIESIGQGGFGITYKAIHIKTGIIRAIKEYFPSDYASRARDGLSIISHTKNKEGDKDVYSWGLESFLKEAQTLAKFNYPTIVKIIDYFEENNTAYLVMEYYEGETLKKYLEKNKNNAFSQDEILNIIMPILEGLKEVHSKGYLHRDIAPDNIFLRKIGLPVLIDFGSSRNSIGNKSKTLSAIIKPGYSPPEQYTFNSNQNASADIYAICAVIYEMVTKIIVPESTYRQTLAFNGQKDPIEDIATKYKNKYPKAFLENIMQGLALRANERIRSVEELQYRLVGEEHPPEDGNNYTIIVSLAIVLMGIGIYILLKKDKVNPKPPKPAPTPVVTVKNCDEGNATDCRLKADTIKNSNKDKALALYKKACDLGNSNACKKLEQLNEIINNTQSTISESSNLDNENIKESYITKLSNKDHYNSWGKRLIKVSDILQQDRANYHKYHKKDSQDEYDSYFSTLKHRQQISTMLNENELSKELINTIIESEPVIKVTVTKDNNIELKLLKK